MNSLLSAALCSALAATVASAAPASPPDAGTAVSAAAHEVLPFIENDYPRALKEAQARGLPLFVDAWAPW